ncbi:MAG: RnfABCDGE type electron transport complex subunit D [Candidatus Eisenbacteria bacterium]|nr:RnfABCDGE type electron transport complex subunit D [Candidatus Eisenbacteria bacterium]
MPERLVVSASPHLREGVSVEKVMYGVVIALVPALAGSIYFFGLRAVLIVLISCVTALATEAAIQRMRRVPVTVADGSALVAGLLLAFNLPPGVPLWMPLVGSLFSIAIGKQVFGGLGYNVLNPALAGRAFLTASWPVHMTTAWAAARAGTLSGAPLQGVDVLTQATPLGVWRTAGAILADPASSTHQLAQAREVLADLGSPDTAMHMFLGNTGGCIGETSALLLLIGAAYLMFKRYIGWRIPVSYIATVAALAWIFGGPDGLFTGNALFHVLAGGLMLGAFFMATDMVTSPVSPKGMLVFGVGCGLLTSVIRLVGGYPEGVCYSILIMNVATPLIDRTTRPRRFGEVGKRA